jgi:type VI protein secretion system component VasF
MQIGKAPEIIAARTKAASGRGRRYAVALPPWGVSAGSLLFGLAWAAAFGCFAQDGHPVVAQTPISSSAETKPQSENGTVKSHKAETAESAHRKQISDESTQLLAMALSLKAEVDKTNKDTLSLKVIRKADEIERLAKTVKERIKQGSGAS